MKKLLFIILLFPFIGLSQTQTITSVNALKAKQWIDAPIFKISGTSIDTSTSTIRWFTKSKNYMVTTAYGWGNHANLYKGKADSVNLHGFATNYKLNQKISSQWSNNSTDVYLTKNVGFGNNYTSNAGFSLYVAGNTSGKTAHFEISSDNPEDHSFAVQDIHTTKYAFNIDGTDKYIGLGESGSGYKTGVNTLTPAYTLDVNGTIYSSSNILSGGAFAGTKYTTRQITDAELSIYPQDKDAPYIRFGAGNDNMTFTTEWGRFILGGNFGLGTTTPTNILSLGGNSARTIWMERHTTTNTAGNSLTLQSGGAKSGATDKGGGMLVLSPGLSTGTGFSSVKIQGLTRAASTGTSDNSLTDRIIVCSEKPLTDNTDISLFDISLAALEGTGGIIHYSVYITDGTDIQTHSGWVNYAAVNKAGVYTTNIVDEPVTEDANAKSAGTLTETWSIATGTNKITINCKFDSSLTPTVMRITYDIQNLSRSTITQL